MSDPLYTLGLDPGRAGFGWGLLTPRLELVAAGVVPQPKGPRDGQQAPLTQVVAAVLRDICCRPAFQLAQVWGIQAAVERMRVYPPREEGNRRSRNLIGELVGKANDLLDLQAIGGLVAGALVPPERVRYWYPAEWKGSLDDEQVQARMCWHAPANVNGERVAGCMTPAERALIEAIKPRGLQHNAWEASGLAMVAAGRLRLV